MGDLVQMSPPALSKGRLWASLAVILFGQFVVSIDLTVLNIALPDLTQELRPSSDQLLWIVDVYSLVLAGLIVAASSLSDRYGRKKTLLGGFFIFAVGSALILIADSPEHVIAIRAFLGIGGAMIMPVTISMVRSIFTDPKERALAVALWSAISALGMAAGPLIGGFLLEHFSWHAAFLVNVPFMGAAILVGVFVLPEVKLRNPGRFDALASLVFLVGMVALLWGIKHVSAELEFDAPGIAALVGGVVMLLLFGLRCLRSDAPLVDLSLFRSKVFSAGIIATVGSTFAMAVLLYLLSQWFQLVNGDGSLEAGMKLVPMAIASLVASTGASMLGMRFPARNVIAGGMVVAAAAMIMLVFFRDDLTLMPVMVSTTLVGLGTGALAIGASIVMSETPVEKASSAGSLQEISYDMGNVLGVAILGSVASIIYRNNLDTGVLRDAGFDRSTIDYCEQSLSVTAEIARQLGLEQVYDAGVEAFNDSVVLTCLVGGIIILVVAVIVWALIPRDVKITDEAGASFEAAPTDEIPGKGVDDDEGAPLEGAFPDAVSADRANEILSSRACAASAASVGQGGPAGRSAVDATLYATASEPSAPRTRDGRVVVSVPLDPVTLDRMDGICRDLGLTTEAAMSVFAHKVVRERGIPFRLELGRAPALEGRAEGDGMFHALDPAESDQQD